MPAFNSYGSWPSSGEIDLVESRGNRNMFNNGLHIGTQVNQFKRIISNNQTCVSTVCITYISMSCKYVFGVFVRFEILSVLQEAGSTLHYGPYPELNGWERAHWIRRNSAGYNSNFHRYQLEWTPGMYLCNQ